MILGYTEELFDQLRAVSKELSAAAIDLEATDYKRYLPDRDRRCVVRLLEAVVAVREKIVALILPVKTEPAQNFWKGFAMALEIADRRDLLGSYPDADDAAKLIEAECLLLDPTPPPVS